MVVEKGLNALIADNVIINFFKVGFQASTGGGAKVESLYIVRFQSQNVRFSSLVRQNLFLS